MDDLRRARQQLRDLLAPVCRVLGSYALAERLGYSSFKSGLLRDAVKPEHWHDDDVLVTIEAAVSAGAGYPVGQYDERELRSCFNVEQAGDRASAIQALHEAVVAKIPYWAAKVAEDRAYVARVGQRLRMLKEVFVSESSPKVAAGSVGTVVQHQPAWLLVEFPYPVGRVWLGTWRYTSGYYRGNSRVLTPDPYWEWLDAAPATVAADPPPSREV